MPILFAKEIIELVKNEAEQVFAGRHQVSAREQLIPSIDNPCSTLA